MMAPVHRAVDDRASLVNGTVRFDYPKALWVGGHLIAAIALAPIFFSWPAFLCFIAMTYLTMLIGHSIGMHRMMIHRTFQTPKWLERTLIYIGVIVGMGGPSAIIRIHDLRDWAQRQSDCHAYFTHERTYFHDLFWQLFCRFDATRPPEIRIEREIAEDGIYQFLDRTWRQQQLALAAILFALGGMPFVVWCVFLRVSLSIVGHWTITYICHNPGPGRWDVDGAAVQASNFPYLAFATHGECWHNNHHAFPESARIGLDPGQPDPAWWVISAMGRIGLATDIGQPRPQSKWDDLRCRGDANGPVSAPAASVAAVPTPPRRP